MLIDGSSASVVDREHARSTDNGPALLDTLAELVGRLVARSPDPVTAIGLGIAGLASSSGTVAYSPNLIGIADYPLGTKLAERTGLPVATLNDATAATWAEAKFGAGRSCDDFLLIGLGTGIGGGFVIGGQLLTGANGYAGEVGHMVIDFDGGTHHTGQRGPWESFASGSALGRMTNERPDATEEEVLNDFCQLVAIGLANLVMIFDPQRIVIGGGVCSIGEPLRSGIERWLDQLTLGRDHRPAVEVVLAELGDDAGAVGAALWAAR